MSQEKTRIVPLTDEDRGRHYMFLNAFSDRTPEDAERSALGSDRSPLGAVSERSRQARDHEELHIFELFVEGAEGDTITGRRHGQIRGVRVHSAGAHVFIEGVTSDSRTRRGGFQLARQTWDRLAAKIRLGKSEDTAMDASAPGDGAGAAPERREPVYGVDYCSDGPECRCRRCRPGEPPIISCADCSHEYEGDPAAPQCPRCKEIADAVSARCEQSYVISTLRRLLMNKHHEEYRRSVLNSLDNWRNGEADAEDRSRLGIPR